MLSTVLSSLRLRLERIGRRGLDESVRAWTRVRAGGAWAYGRTVDGFVRWLVRERRARGAQSPINFARLIAEAHMGDVLLVEGQSRIARAVRAITHSIWTHSALVIGHLDELRDPALRSIARRELTSEELEAPLIVESELGRGTIVSSILRYRDHHVRLCRPLALAPNDARRVATYALLHVGAEYDLRHILDLARFLVPWWWFMPRRWHSSLFEHRHNDPTRQICSTMIARAFSRVRYPVSPLIVDRQGQLTLLRRNSRLITPSEFDHSPYFSIIKYSLFGDDDLGFYRELPWSEEGVAMEQLEDYLEDLDIKRVRLDDPAPEGRS